MSTAIKLDDVEDGQTRPRCAPGTAGRAIALCIRRDIEQIGDVASDPRDVERIAHLESQLDAALTGIEELEEQLRTSSRNSSKPPSSDPPSGS